eukprot:COSAG05_NODE_3015_length_2414_cov_75.142549_3_plen_34_part_01
MPTIPYSTRHYLYVTFLLRFPYLTKCAHLHGYKL